MTSQAVLIRDRADARADRDRPSIVDVLTSSPDEVFQYLPLRTIASHPDNPREQLGDLTGLADAIREHGVLQPVVVVPVEVFRRTTETLTDIDAGALYVVQYGHRRVAAAPLAGLSEVPAIIRGSYVDDDDALAKMAAENVSRAGLTPIEEARTFGKLLDRPGMSLRKVASRVGVVHTYVRRRHQLLQLPPVPLAGLQAGRLTVTDAEHLVEKLKDPDLMTAAYERMTATADGPRLTADAAVRAVLADREIAAATTASLAVLASLGLDSVDPAELWGRLADRHLLDDDLSPTMRREHPACLRGAIGVDGTLTWYCADPGAHGTDMHTDAELAARARTDACRRLLQHVHGHDASAAFLHTLPLGPVRHPTALKQAARWAADLGWLPDGQTWRDYPAWIGTGHGGTRAAARFVAALAVAYDEQHARLDTEHWTERDRMHLTRLIEKAQHSPSAWEMDRLRSIPGDDLDGGDES